MANGEGIAAYDPKVWIRQAREDLLVASGVTPLDLARTIRRHRKLLNAQTTKFFADKGVVQDERSVADNATRMRAVEAFYDVFGVRAPKDPPTPSQAVTVAFDATSGRLVIQLGAPSAPLPVVVEGASS